VAFDSDMNSERGSYQLVSRHILDEDYWFASRIRSLVDLSPVEFGSSTTHFEARSKADVRTIRRGHYTCPRRSSRLMLGVPSERRAW